MKTTPWRWKRLRRLIMIGVFGAYLMLYFATTSVRKQGHGGLTGPLRVRVFANENHLLVFYPMYLVERWARNWSFTRASYDFNVAFEGRDYRRVYLYGDGKYSRIWYDPSGREW